MHHHTRIDALRFGDRWLCISETDGNRIKLRCNRWTRVECEYISESIEKLQIPRISLLFICFVHSVHSLHLAIRDLSEYTLRFQDRRTDNYNGSSDLDMRRKVERVAGALNLLSFINCKHLPWLWQDKLIVFWKIIVTMFSRRIVSVL